MHKANKIFLKCGYTQWQYPKNFLNKGHTYYMVASSPEWVQCNLFTYTQYNSYFIRKQLEIKELAFTKGQTFCQNKMWHIFPALTTNYAHGTTGIETLT